MQTDDKSMARGDTPTRPLVSIAIPAYNESENLPELFRRLGTVAASLDQRFKFQFVVCENGSSDSTHEVLQALLSTEPRLEVIRLSRNFLMEGGMMAALSQVKGDVCVIMSADLQDPPEMIPSMLELWEKGYEHVYTVITKRHGESAFRRAAAQIFYWLINKVSDTPVPRNASDFRLVNKNMYVAFNSLPEKFRMVRSTWGWLGFTSTSLEYERPPRLRGTSSFNPFVTAGYAIRGLLSSSLKPLKIIPVIGLFFAFTSLLGLVLSIVRAVAFGVPFSGYAALLSSMFLLFGFLFLLLSVIAEYIGMIFIETRGRPPFVVRSTEGENSSKVS